MTLVNNVKKMLNFRFWRRWSVHNFFGDVTLSLTAHERTTLVTLVSYKHTQTAKHRSSKPLIELRIERTKILVSNQVTFPDTWIWSISDPKATKKYTPVLRADKPFKKGLSVVSGFVCGGGMCVCALKVISLWGHISVQCHPYGDTFSWWGQKASAHKQKMLEITFLVYPWSRPPQEQVFTGYALWGP